MYIISGTKYYGRKGLAPWVVVCNNKAFPHYSKASAQKTIDDLKAKGLYETKY